ncbi:ADP-ribosylglycohydrolase family protein [Nocardiopsis sp. HUAS JQ3]|uniref:ADP-ribosylglycohydrolase family protein n=1 Tax=Nocardiopsis sp. HUAS JQ3 TaxID=3061629 RepID=UPI0023AA05FB|nr:ADP-ribosylglycohydrolase family protein [Nocardiopsis sp. HUAS JQ3]WDZ88355.1 ADP-ribosylglycohydrolase family protein [Nocardiopsis sp. HUAS JQ3]
MHTFAAPRPARALSCLSALAVGDAFGSQFFAAANRRLVEGRELPPGPWRWSDDTEMAASVHAEAVRGEGVDPDRLAGSFARHHDADRGYGAATGRLLGRVREGGDWRTLAAELFEGSGSFGNGAAMRVAPLGAWYADDPGRAAREAAVSARVTHTHPEAVDGAVAVAVAAALAARREPVGPGPFLDGVVEGLRPGRVREAVGAARGLLVSADPLVAAADLGNGSRVSALDTVPFALWVAARHGGVVSGARAGGGGFAPAMWAAVAAGGDMDTTCAIVAGILGAGLPGGRVPAAWAERTEELPGWALADEEGLGG